MSNIVIYGRGKTGMELLKMLQKDNNVVLCDDKDGINPESIEIDNTDLLALSPGVFPIRPLVRKCLDRGVRVVSELQLAWERFKGKTVAVTGTNGKTTVVTMLSHVLDRLGVDNILCGNVGIPFAHFADDSGIAIVECSSFQLKYCDTFSPYVSIFTNVDSDHTDYHGSVEDYIKSKCNIFRRQRDGYAIFNADDSNVLDLSGECNCRTLFYSTTNKCANCYIDGKDVVLNTVDKFIRVQSEKIATMYRHNQSNVLAVLLALYCLGVDFAESVTAAESYTFLPHRLQLVGSCGKVDFVNDSKATNVHATLSALKSVQGNIALIAGGSDKDTDFHPLAKGIGSNVRLVCTIGQTADSIAACLRKTGCTVVKCSSMEEAVNVCFDSLKHCGGTVLLSPACASFDMYNSYIERGEHFTAVVKGVCSAGQS